MEKYLAKSNGETLIDHSLIVNNVSLELSKIILSDEYFERYAKILNHASLLHDIGKLTDSFQKKMKDVEKKSGRVYRHNEIGWAFLSKYYTGEYKDLLLYLVFWHHGISNRLDKINDDLIIDTLSAEEITRMSNYLSSSIGEEYLITDEDEIIDSDTNRAPLYYDDENKFMFQWKMIYGCLVSADRIASSKFDNLEVELYNYIHLSEEFDPIKNWVFKDSERSKRQIEIIDKCAGTTMVNAPAGFGKTIMGLLWGLKRNKKIIWVCPRNTIAESVYESIVSELNNMRIQPTVELMLGGEIKKGGNGDLFKSDIIITNIDNFLSPSNNNSLLKYYSLINSASVVFDEYHELIGETPLFAAFINIMRGRHLIGKSETLLLSATPNLINHLWEGAFKKTTQILPNDGEHFEAQHNIPFRLNVYRSNDINGVNDDNSLVIYNSISNAQRNMFSGKYGDLFHSKFTDIDRNYKLVSLLNNHGKNGSSNNNIIGTHVLQASLDISFKNVYESCLSPDSTIQRLGRNNRWGELKDTSFTSVQLDSNKSERVMYNILYNNNLQSIWFEFLSEYNGSYITLDEMYAIYNEFYKTYRKEIRKEVKQLFNVSNQKLNKIHPIKFFSNNKKSDILTAGGNKMRTNGNDVFYILRNVDGGWSDIFSEEVLGDFDIHFNESDNILPKILKVMKGLRNDLDNRFDYNDILNRNKYGKGVTLDYIRRMSKKSNTPYIRFDKVYDPELGVISIKLLNLIKNDLEN